MKGGCKMTEEKKTDETKVVTEVKMTTACIFVGAVAGISSYFGYKIGYRNAIRCISDILLNGSTSIKR